MLHFRLFCKACKDLISECDCNGDNKPTVWTVCDDCKGKVLTPA